MADLGGFVYNLRFAGQHYPLQGNNKYRFPMIGKEGSLRMVQFIKKHSLLVAVGLCAVAAGLAAAFTVNNRSGESKLTPEQAGVSQLQEEDTVWQDGVQETPVAKNQTGVAKSSKDSSVSSRSSAGGTVSSGAGTASSGAADSLIPSAPDTGYSAPLFVKPVSGKVSASFSGEELVFDETMQDWRTHNGTDFVAACGDEVCSITDGMVTEIRQDALWGTVVTVQSEQGLFRYAGLAERTKVKQGQKVSAGEQLGKLDEIPGEIALAPHLHVEYEVDGVLQDVMTLLEG